MCMLFTLNKNLREEITFLLGKWTKKDCDLLILELLSKLLRTFMQRTLSILNSLEYSYEN